MSLVHRRWSWLTQRWRASIQDAGGCSDRDFFGHVLLDLHMAKKGDTGGSSQTCANAEH